MLPRMAAPMEPSRWTVRLAWGLCLLSLACIAVTIVLAIVNRDSIQTPDDASVLEIVLPLGFAVLGGMVASRLPGNTLGWVFLAIALCSAIPGPATQYARYALITSPGTPFTPWISWIGEFAATLVYPGGLATLAFLLTPNGVFLSPRWRWVAWAGAVATSLVLFLSLAEPEVGVPPVPSPTYVPALAELSIGLLGDVAFLAGLGALAASGASVIIRLRRSRGDERLQLRWVAYAATFAIVSNVVLTIVMILLVPDPGTAIPWFVTVVATAGFGVVLPLAFGIAILRYRLYDLDYFLNRTVVYGTATVILAGVFLALYFAAQSVMQTVFNQRSDLIAAALGAGAALAFGPMRRALQPAVDRLLPARSRLTLLFTDIVESTQAIVDLGDEQWRDVLSRYRAMVRRELARCRGREVNTAGDAFFAVFGQPLNGVQCALAMRDEVRELGLRVRTGLHYGEVETRGEQVTGLAVHAAARVMSTAGEDQVVISSDLAEALGDAVPIQDAGRQALRGVPGEWQLYRVG
jgi:class 3 adenylate cyclase